MNPQDLQNEIADLRTNVAALIEGLSEMRKSDLQLRQQISELKSENTNYKEQISFLEEKNKMLGLATAVPLEEKLEMKRKIRELVRDIDDCITMINK
ncbi:MAG: hypothetical protein RIC15_05360 [Vicingaceae bacterium]